MKRTYSIFLLTIHLFLFSGLIHANNTLLIDQQLDIGDSLESDNGNFRLTLQSDNNVVLYNDSNAALWASNTVRTGGERLVLQRDGNLVLYTSSGRAVWASNTENTDAERLSLESNGTLALFDKTTPIWIGYQGEDESETFSLDRRISRASDDVEERANGNMYIDSSDIELVYDGNVQTVGLRFTDIEIPKGAEIVEAYIQFTVDERNNQPTYLTIQAESSSDSPAFGNNKFNLTNRLRTSESVYWEPSEWQNIGASNSTTRTPNLAGIVQEVIKLSGWNSGNSLSFIITGAGERTAESFEGSQSKAALLHVKYKYTPDDNNGRIDYIDSTATYNSKGDINISVPNATNNQDLLLLFLSRTDDLLPIKIDGWTAGASCFKTTNGQSSCHEIPDCIERDGNYCRKFAGGNGRDLATVVFYKTATNSTPSNYRFDLRGNKPAWAILATVRGASNNDPIRSAATTSNDKNADSLFPSVFAKKGDLLLLSQAFDDTTNKNDFMAPNGMQTFNWIAGPDEAGYLFGANINETGETGTKKTRGPGGPKAKDALISISIK